MNIPDEVKLAALRATASDGWMTGKVDPALEVIAEWARKEALQEAADKVLGDRLLSVQPNKAQVREWLLLLAEKTPA